MPAAHPSTRHPLTSPHTRRSPCSWQSWRAAPSAERDLSITDAGLTIVSALTTVAVLALVASVRPLTPTGSELRDYLKGTQLYISLAETDRLRVLQSPEGALRSPPAARRTAAGSPSDAGQVSDLYERMLPLAVLFGEDKRWSGVLGQYYDTAGVQSRWYSGSGVVNAALLSTQLGSFTATTTASWSGRTPNSSSTGAGGGGFAGGGGGGR